MHEEPKAHDLRFCWINASTVIAKSLPRNAYGMPLVIRFKEESSGTESMGRISIHYIEIWTEDGAWITDFQVENYALKITRCIDWQIN